MTEATHISIDELRTDPAKFRRAILIPTDAGPKPCDSAIDPWQREDFAAMDNGLRQVVGLPLLAGLALWLRIWLERARGHSKTTDLALAVLWILFAANRPLRGYAAAADKEQAGLLLDSIRMILALNPWLAALFEIQRSKVICLTSGATLEILASDVASSYGLRPDFIIADEVTHWAKRDLFDSLLSAAAKSANCMFISITNAGVGQGTSWQWKVRETVRTDESWYFKRQDGPVASWITKENLAEQKRLLPPGAYARLWLNQWQSGSGKGLDTNAVEQCVTLTGPHPRQLSGWHYIGALDLGLKRDHAAYVILGVSERSQEPVHVAHLESWNPVDYGGTLPLELVATEIRRCRSVYGCQWVIYDPWQAEYLAQQMRWEGFEFSPWLPTSKNLDNAATTLIACFTDQTIRLYPDDRLTNDLARLTIKQRANGQFKIESTRDESGHCDRATALSMGLPAAAELQGEFFPAFQETF